jgi:membrane peptidoglycan carboxypeptidase
MAIKINRPKQEGRLGKFITFIVVLGIIAASAYALFFAPTPVFDYIASPELERNRQLSTFNLDPEDIINREDFRALRRFDVNLQSGSFGKANPLTP